MNGFKCGRANADTRRRADQSNFQSEIRQADSEFVAEFALKACQTDGVGENVQQGVIFLTLASERGAVYVQ